MISTYGVQKKVVKIFLFKRTRYTLQTLGSVELSLRCQGSVPGSGNGDENFSPVT